MNVPKEGRMLQQSLIAVVHNLVLESPKSAKALAKEIGKPYATLLREINPNDTGAKLGAETLLELMQCSGNIEPLRYLAENMGYRVVPANGAPQPVVEREYDFQPEFTLPQPEEVDGNYCYDPFWG